MKKSNIILATMLVAGSLFVLSSVAKPPPEVLAAKGPSIVEIALAVNADTGEFSTLIAALVAADLVDALNGMHQYTVFAPTDEAFAALGLDADNIGDMDKATLTKILLYHVAPGERFAEDVVESERIRTLSKQFLFPEVTEDGVFILDEIGASPDAQVILPDVDARNGVIHVIDNVLLPPDFLT
jgi:uncharacterized surface protein with fasciclin (FAS1) repeats